MWEGLGPLWEGLGALGPLWEGLGALGLLWEGLEALGSLWEGLEAVAGVGCVLGLDPHLTHHGFAPTGP